MKQYVTQAQIDNVSPKVKKELTAWWYKRGYQYNPFDADGSEINDPPMSVGQMIGFLNEHEVVDDRNSYIDESYDNVIVCGVAGYSNELAIGGNGEKLCDSLWRQVVKIADGKVIK
jgi:hypothetical protein